MNEQRPHRYVCPVTFHVPYGFGFRPPSISLVTHPALVLPSSETIKGPSHLMDHPRHTQILSSPVHISVTKFCARQNERRERSFPISWLARRCSEAGLHHPLVGGAQTAEPFQWVDINESVSRDLGQSFQSIENKKPIQTEKKRLTQQSRLVTFDSQIESMKPASYSFKVLSKMSNLFVKFIHLVCDIFNILD